MGFYIEHKLQCYSICYVVIYLLLPIKTQHNHVLSQSQHQEDDAEEAPANEEPHEAPEAAGQIPDVIGVELILPCEAGRRRLTSCGPS